MDPTSFSMSSAMSCAALKSFLHNQIQEGGCASTCTPEILQDTGQTLFDKYTANPGLPYAQNEEELCELVDNPKNADWGGTGYRRAQTATHSRGGCFFEPARTLPRAYLNTTQVRVRVQRCTNSPRLGQLS